MFPQVDIVRWRAVAPWADDDVEQDLVITLALFDIFSDESLKKDLAFRGGTALHKLHLAPPASRPRHLAPTCLFVPGVAPEAPAS